MYVQNIEWFKTNQNKGIQQHQGSIIMKSNIVYAFVGAGVLVTQIAAGYSDGESSRFMNMLKPSSAHAAESDAQAVTESMENVLRAARKAEQSCLKASHTAQQLEITIDQFLVSIGPCYPIPCSLDSSESNYEPGYVNIPSSPPYRYAGCYICPELK
ncbi:MAG: hypothetical protein SFW62_09655 [Alphaproteobacteria bacterium]|nr:hypothetical protein [Alphaproteobacteria bacterium]